MKASSEAPALKRARKLFEAELKRRGLPFAMTLDGRYQVERDGVKLTLSLDNIARDMERDGDPTMMVNFIDRALSPFVLPTWEVARSLVYWSAEPSDHAFGDALREQVTNTVVRVLVVTDADEERITWITPSHLKTWNISIADLQAAAGQNLDRLLEGKRLAVDTIDGFKLGMVPVSSAFKASTIFAPSFKIFVEADLPWPVLVVIPCRDFIYVLAEGDQALLGRMGQVVQREFRGSGYPITTEVLRISGEGVEAIGAFPT